MLFILGLPPEDGAEIELQRVEVVFATLEACDEAGTQLAGRLTREAAEATQAVYEHRCIALPKGEEVDRAFHEWNGEAE